MINRRERETTRGGQVVSTKRTALFELLIALASVLEYVELLIPVYLEAPGVKLGLANLVIMTTPYCMEVKTAVAVSVVRTFLSGFTSGPTPAILLSLAGAAFSLTMMAVYRKFHLFGMARVSILGGMAHSVGQFLIVTFVIHTFGVFSYLPVLLAAGTTAGALIGLLGGVVVQRTSHVIREI